MIDARRCHADEENEETDARRDALNRTISRCHTMPANQSISQPQPSEASISTSTCSRMSVYPTPSDESRCPVHVRAELGTRSLHSNRRCCSKAVRVFGVMGSEIRRESRPGTAVLLLRDHLRACLPYRQTGCRRRRWRTYSHLLLHRLRPCRHHHQTC